MKKTVIYLVQKLSIYWKMIYKYNRKTMPIINSNNNKFQNCQNN